MHKQLCHLNAFIKISFDIVFVSKCACCHYCFNSYAMPVVTITCLEERTVFYWVIVIINDADDLQELLLNIWPACTLPSQPCLYRINLKF